MAQERRVSRMESISEGSVAFSFESLHNDLATAFSCKSFGDAIAGIAALRRTSLALHAAAESDKAANADSLLREVAAIAIQCVWRRCAAKAYVSDLKAERKRRFHLGAKAELDEMRLVMAQGAVRRHQAQQLLNSKLAQRQQETGIKRVTSTNKIASKAAPSSKHYEELGELAQNTAATWIQSQVRRHITAKEVEGRRSSSPSPGLDSKTPSAGNMARSSSELRPTQRTKGSVIPLTGYALGAIFWDASRMLLDSRRPASFQLWGLRILHGTCMSKKKDVANRQLNKRSGSINRLSAAPLPTASTQKPPIPQVSAGLVPVPPLGPSPALIVWFPDMPFSLWVQGPLTPVPLGGLLADLNPAASAAATGLPNNKTMMPLAPPWCQRAYPEERLRSALNLRPVGTTGRHLQARPPLMPIGVRTTVQARSPR
jgi:hypothetical protein